MPHFVADVEAIRRRAEQKIEDGAVTTAYRGDVKNTIEILNEALATEIVCVLRYMHHYFMATGVHGSSVANEFKEHADAERDHADKLAERIQQLGGKPDFNPKSLLQRSASQYVEGETLADMIREDLIAERIVIEVYQEMVRHFANNDPTTRHIIEVLLADEEEHASDLADLLYVVDPHTGEAEGQHPGTNPLQLPGAQRPSGEEETKRAGKQGRAQTAHEMKEAEDALQGIANRTSSQGFLGQKKDEARPSASSRAAQSQRTRDEQPIPGTAGRTMNRRGARADELEEIETTTGRKTSGGHSGGTRSASLTNKKNKKRAA